LCWEFQTGIDLLDMTPYSRGKCSVLAAPVVWGERVVAGGNDGVLYLLDAASGACVSQTRFGAPISAAPCVLREGICVGTWDGRLYCFTY
jgi:outer membrane protein assembly factor BamB